jgi:GNAT superfamily N-acetyltransferase
MNSKITFRFAVAGDCARLAEWNHQLIRDEGHRNPMNVAQLEERMRGWLKGEYRAVIFEEAGEWVAYILYREEAAEIYLRQLFVRRDRRGQGIGRTAVEIIRGKIWPKDRRLTLEVLTGNAAALAFWRAMGYRDYALTMEVMPKKDSGA